MATLYELMGPDDATRQARIANLVDHFYAAMDTRPEAAVLRAMHPPDLATSREKLYLFLLGWIGGPQTYQERFGHPRLRARHLPFRIDTDAAEQWMQCMASALDAYVPEPEVHDAFLKALARLALHMRNAEPTEPNAS